MSSLHAILKITTLIWYITIVLSSDDLRRTSMQTTITQEDSSQYIVPNSFFEIGDNPDIYYATCKNISSDIHTCTVIRETQLNSKASVRVIDSCDIRLNVSDFNENIRDIVALFPMTGGNVALLQKFLGETVRFTLVNVLHCNKSSPVITKLPTYADIRYIVSMDMPLVVYQDSYELMMEDVADCDMSESTTCLVKYNYAGEKLGARLLKHRGSRGLYSVQVDDESKGSYSFSVDKKLYNGWSLNICHVAPDGEVHLIAKDILGFMPGEFYTSYAHGLFSICRRISWPYESLRCLQVDKEKVLVNATLSVKALNEAHWLAVHNIPGGGILLASGKNSIAPSFQLRHLTKDARNADRWLNVESFVEPFECSSSVSGLLSLRIRVMEDKGNKEVCFHFVCHNKWVSNLPRKSGWKILYERVCVPELFVKRFLKKKL